MIEVSPESTRAGIRICPAWCRYSHAEHRLHDAGEQWLHGGQGNDRFEFWQLDGGPVTATLNHGISGDIDLTADDLRALAASAMGAADWIENAV